MKPGDLLPVLVLHFAVVALFAIGGASVVVPEMYRLAVVTEHWMSAQQFTDLFAIAQAAPGPNVLIVSLIGWQVAGLPGALAATAAFCLPGAVLAHALARIWQRFRDAPWRLRIQSGLAPITVGLVAATALVLARGADHGAASVAITLACAIAAYASRINPLWLLGAGGLIGGLGGH